MNNAVGPISNENVAEKWNLWVLCTVHGTHRTDKGAEKSTNYSYYSWTVAVVPLNVCTEKKKKKCKREMQPPNPNRTLIKSKEYYFYEYLIASGC